MEQTNIKPDKITKPIQLLAAALLGLILTNGSFLAAAAQLDKTSWLPAALIIATICNVPLFLFSIFLLQTKFRPEMQEDTFYSQYLERKYSTSSVTEEKLTSIKKKDHEELNKTVEMLMQKLHITETQKRDDIESLLVERDAERVKFKVAEKRTLSELWLHPEDWDELVDEFGGDPAFKADIETLLLYGVVKGNARKPRLIKLTALGKKIAQDAEKEGVLWNQKHPGNIRFRNRPATDG